MKIHEDLKINGKINLEKFRLKENDSAIYHLLTQMNVGHKIQVESWDWD